MKRSAEIDNFSLSWDKVLYIYIYLFICVSFRPPVFQAVKLTSSRTQLPYEYYSLPFCKPKSVFYKGENLGKWDAWEFSVVSLKFSIILTLSVPLDSYILQRVQDIYFVKYISEKNYTRERKLENNIVFVPTDFYVSFVILSNSLL